MAFEILPVWPTEGNIREWPDVENGLVVWAEQIDGDWDVYGGAKPPYEQREDVLNRALQFVARARLEYAEQHVVAVSHGDVIAYLTLWAKGEQITNLNKSAVYELCLEPASITTMIFKSTSQDERPEVDCIVPYERGGLP